jgi:hypothetical protein
LYFPKGPGIFQISPRKRAARRIEGGEEFFPSGGLREDPEFPGLSRRLRFPLDIWTSLDICGHVQHLSSEV